LDLIPQETARLSTFLDSTDALLAAEVSDPVFSLAALVARLESQTSAPTLKQIYNWLETAQVSAEELAPYVGFKDGNYWRHLVCRNEFVEMLVLCWRPGQRTPIHDHSGSHGGVRVCTGTMWETTFSYDPVAGLEYKAAREYHTGAVTGADVPDIHQLGNPDVSEQDMVTIHIYAPPLGVLHTYKPGSAVIDLYTPPDPE
jgi:cysteine dioxygenase